MDNNLHSVARRLIELKMARAELVGRIDRLALERPRDELSLRRLEKQRLKLNEQIRLLEAELDPPQPA